MRLDPETLHIVGTFVGGLMTLVLVVVDRAMPRRMDGRRKATAA
jgi:hypothetical protein